MKYSRFQFTLGACIEWKCQRNDADTNWEREALSGREMAWCLSLVGAVCDVGLAHHSIVFKPTANKS